jgi:hypothetical protein
MVADCCFFSSRSQKTVQHNILGAAQAKDNNDDKTIMLALSALKNNNQRMMVTEHGSGRSRRAMEGCEREMR